MATKDEKAWQEWLDLKKRIAAATPLPVNENESLKQKRIKSLESNFTAWCQYYFPDYTLSPFGYFHQEAAKEIISNPQTFTVLEWPREHAKSVFLDIFIVAYLYFKNQINSLILVSQTSEKANKLLGDIQAQFEANRRLINDYGDHRGIGSWADGEFRTKTGTGFHAFGAGQSARGIRDGSARPDFCIVDDIDTNERCRNEQRVDDALEWLQSDIFGACSIKQCRYIIAGNRIHKKSILAKLVGDIEETDPKNAGITLHSKVYAFEDQNHQKADHITGRPAWHQNYTAEDLLRKFRQINSYSAIRREYFHEHIAKGKIFKAEQIQFGKMLPLNQYKGLVTYVDPSYKDTKKSDFKAVVLLGLTGTQYHVIDCWVRQASVLSMVQWHYNLGHKLMLEDVNCSHWIEANFIQDIHLNEYRKHGESIGWMLPIKGDTRAKPDKFGRIEALQASFEQGNFIFNEDKRKSVDMQTLIDQFIAFPTGHDDGPDAVESGRYKLQSTYAAKSTPLRGGKYIKPTHRSL